MTALLTISYSRRRPAQRISLKAGNWQLRSPPNTRHLKAVGVLRAVEQPGSRVAGQHGCVGVAVQGLGVVCPANLEAAAGVQAVPLDALIGQRAVGGRAALRGLVQACVAEEFFCAQVACVVAVLGQGLRTAAVVLVHADELVLGVPVVADAGGDGTLCLRLREAVAVGVVGVAGAGCAADLDAAGFDCPALAGAAIEGVVLDGGAAATRGTGSDCGIAASRSLNISAS